MAYNLGLVKPHVRRAADQLGPKHGIKTVYGFGPGSVPGSDHPKGLALDFMTSNKATGDALANDAITNAAALGVTYVIWWAQIWKPGEGWKPYTGPRKHRDHVHISFAAKPGTGLPITDPVKNPLVPDAIEELVQVFKDFNKAFVWITDANNWKRIGLFAAGGVLIFIAVVRWDNTKQLASKAVKYAKQ